MAQFYKDARLREKKAEDRRVHDTDYLAAELVAAIRALPADGE